MVELRVLEQIVMFQKQKTLSKTARQLHISQPALSQSFKELERSLGLPLFERSSHNRIRLNEHGEVLADYAKKILALEADMEAALKALQNDLSNLQVLSCTPAPVWKLEEALEKAGLPIALNSETEEEDERILAALENGSCTLGIVHLRPSGTDWVCMPWIEERLALAIPQNHPLAKHSEIHLGDLKNQNLLLFEDIGFWKKWTKKNLPDTHFLYAPRWETFEQAAAFGGFPYFITEESGFSAPAGQVIARLLPPASASYFLVGRRADAARLEDVFEAARKFLKDREAKKKSGFPDF